MIKNFFRHLNHIGLCLSGKKKKKERKLVTLRLLLGIFEDLHSLP